MHPLLLAAACKGDLKELRYLLDRTETEAQPDMMPSKEFLDQLQLPAYSSGCCSNGNLGLQQAAADLEEGATVEALSAASLLEGVTLEGNNALHVVAANGDEGNLEHNKDKGNFVRCANLIHSKDRTLLSKQNNKGDTPLHNAARAGKSEMVSHLIVLARGDGMVEEFVRKENNRKETALHEAVRIGNNDIVMVLLEADPRLAYYPAEGTSALYLAVLQDEESIAQTLYDKSEGEGEGRFLSYSGPDGQNALHAAVLRGTGMVEKILKWNQKLASQWDCNGSTPIHFVSSRPRLSKSEFIWASFSILSIRVPFLVTLHVQDQAMRRLLEANPAALYQPDKDGLYPIHIAASVGNRLLLAEFIKYNPSIAGLQDRRGRTFVHVAVEKSKRDIVSFACGTRSLDWILNMQDKNGNTALHLAVLARSLRMFCSLLGNRQVHINITNNKGQAPLDIARDKVPSGLYSVQTGEAMIHITLKQAGARHVCRRWDHFEEKSIKQEGDDGESKELEKLKDSTQTLCIGSVLIATVAFGATFALPGGYRADDHTNGGTPTLAGRYAFDAFMVAITLAFICSSVATVGFMFSGTSMVDLKSRTTYFVTATFFMFSSVTSMTAAFTLSVYLVLAPVAHKTAVAIVVMSPVVVIFTNIEIWPKNVLVARAMGSRFGLTLVFMMSPVMIPVALFFQCWPFVIIFGWAAIARNH